MANVVLSSNCSTVSGLTHSISGDSPSDDSIVSATFFNGNPEMSPTRNDTLLGRKKEIQLLRESFRRIAAPGAASEMILIAGSSGTGKTSLVESSLRNPVTRADGFFVEAKFEQVRTNIPFPALTAILSDLCDLVSQDKTGLPSVQEKIKNSIGEGDEAALSVLVSNLSQVTGKTYSMGWTPSSGSMSQTFQRFKVACKQLIRVIASPEHPVVIFLDDLQWSDMESLDTLRDLMTDSSNNIMLIGVYRNDESASGLVEEMFHADNSQTTHRLKTARIVLANLDQAATEELVASILRMPASRVVELSTILYGKTDGNPFYLKELISSLQYRGDIELDNSSSCWTWNTTRIRDEIDVTENVLGIVEQKLQSLSQQLQSLLTIAAYIGFRFSEDVLIDFVIHEESDIIGSIPEAIAIVQQVLNDAVKMGLIEFGGRGTFRFRHDKIQQCILDIVTIEEHESLSCRLGWFLHAGTSKYGQHTVFSAAYNLSKGLAMINDPTERLLVARINLAAGLEAKAVASFHSAAEYAGTALQILGTPHPWDSEYDLTIALCTLTVESKQCLGEFDDVEHLITEIIQNAKTSHEKWPAHKVAIEDYANRTGNMRKAINMCVNAARSFGDDFPEKPNAIHLIKPHFHVRRMLKRMTDEDLLLLSPLPNDDVRHIISDVNRCLQAYTFIIGDEVRFVLSSLRSLESSIKRGYFTFMTPSAFATYGFVCSMFGDYESATRYAALAERMLDRWNLQQGGGRVSVVSYGLYHHQTRTAYDCALGLQRGIEIGLASGEIEEAHYCAAIFSLFIFNSGRRLSEVTRCLGDLHDQFSVYDQHHAQFYRIVLAATANLMGLSDEPTQLTNDLIDEDEALQFATKVNNLVQVYTFQSIKASLLFHFGFFEEAGVYADKLRNEKRLGLQDHLNFFYFGLIYFELARGQGGRHRRRFLSLARKCLKGLRRVNSANPNTEPLLYILEAEHCHAASSASSRIWSVEVESKYDRAITTAAQRELPQFEALANERAAMAMEQKASDVSARYMLRAKELYWDWDAEAKFEYLEERDAERNAQQARR